MVHHISNCRCTYGSRKYCIGLPVSQLNMKKITEDIQKLVNKYGFDLDLSKKSTKCPFLKNRQLKL